MRGAPGFSDGNGDFLSGYVYCRQNNTRKWGAQRAQHQKNAYFGKCGTATTTLTILARAMRGTPGSPDRMGISVRVMPTVGRIIHGNGVPSELNTKKTRTSVKCGIATTTLTILARAMRDISRFQRVNATRWGFSGFLGYTALAPDSGTRTPRNRVLGEYGLVLSGEEV